MTDPRSARRAVALRMARANQHLEDVDRLVAAYVDSRPYKVVGRVEGKRHEYIYRLSRVTEPDEQITVIVGDALHNLRSVLNYCMAGCVPNSRRRKTQFPVFAEDPFRHQPGSRRYVERKPERRRAWSTWTKGLHPDALAIVKAAQPFQSARDGAHSYLGILNALDNDDKHSRLNVISNGAQRVTLFVHDTNGDLVHSAMQWDGILLQDGTELFRSPTSMQVDINCRPQVAIEIGEGRHLPIGELTPMREYIESVVVAPLAPHFRD